MPLTVITMKNCPPSLRGDLSKWMQEIATGVYVGNFNSRVREALWERVSQNVGVGEATMSYAYRNEIGYRFETINAKRQVVDYEGIPLVLLPNTLADKKTSKKHGFSKIAKQRQAKKYSISSKNRRDGKEQLSYIIIDIETTGLDPLKDSIIEIAALAIKNGEIVKEFDCLVNYEGILPLEITSLTGIADQLLKKEGQKLEDVLKDFKAFIGEADLVGYNISFDIKFINYHLKQLKLPKLNNKSIDLMSFVKKEKLFLSNYKLETALPAYGINEEVPHRALADVHLIYRLALKVNKFSKFMNKQSRR
ncbi:MULTISPECIES: type I-E CRISPR-associated endoribonuclease Cas2e [Aerococcus]|uniref:type I-E CRISPR-associated endoribonuclease Cas2e n=1 Tax=Aerococcus TaxID=1375 RepID=UPI0018A77844|nr:MULTISPECIES: type I-E CRISPR-associated endoribonuclease Cas2e [Aerococcus]MCY3035522.1 type I-E CRISPR-associated endoribonuclease Cas2e [Aerococcus sp. Group 2]MCY3039197.1 type I-E CRISPR-associated endoribonuclease Cas2e [Aerococcus sp. Group 2]MCY3041098.1 type I-E CRISPR-associated endoribonuclease Cas2e [Aerococcus sp. Group 2]MCY3042336.1 type I-E CRISPR-associated endoribonuclease Cas2e [Aerococcus sp. Group 2]MDK6521364.1 type I-E CRISPR-associated endoribonuclease Cas2e [Aerococ